MGFIIVMGSFGYWVAYSPVHPHARTGSGYTYFIHYPRDPLWLKSLVVFLVAMCIADTVAIGYVSRQPAGPPVIRPFQQVLVL